MILNHQVDKPENSELPPVIANISKNIGYKSSHSMSSNIGTNESITIAGDNNFTATALVKGWSGNGSNDDPIIIENYNFTGTSDNLY